MPTKIILDVDTGTDDALALMIASLSPDIDLLAATTVSGNVPVENCTENTLRVFDLLGVDTPVYQGMSHALVRTDATHSTHVHGSYLDLPPSRSAKQPGHAVDFLVETFLASGGDIVLAAVGPLTNVASMLRREPCLAEKIPELVIMGGGHSIGNATPSAEFNIWYDPEAAHVVFHSGIPIRLMPLDVTHKALMRAEHIPLLEQIDTPAARAAAGIVRKRFEFYSTVTSVPPNTIPVHDTLVVCAILAPDLVTMKDVYMDIELKGQLTYGRTVMDLFQRTGQAPNAQVAFEVDADRYVAMMFDLLGRPL